MCVCVLSRGNDGYISLPALAYLGKGQYGFHQDLDEVGDTRKPGGHFEEGNSCTKRDWLVRPGEINGGALKAEIVNERKEGGCFYAGARFDKALVA